MAGVYIHIPFCKQACSYCDFHFSASSGLKEALVSSLLKEIEMRKNFFAEPVETVYFGGGTPSILSTGHLESLLRGVFSAFRVDSNAEITLEANPDDLTPAKLGALKTLGFNRLSIGMQTFDGQALKLLNRAHSRSEAVECYLHARAAGFENINCDLIYAIPGQSLETLKKDLRQMTALNPEHISAYCLTIEEKTAFGRWLKQGRLRGVEDDDAAVHFETVCDALSAAGYEQYEISNFCKAGFESRHNSGYWRDKPYLGIGPSAHSYDGARRWYNVSHNPRYVKAIAAGQLPIYHDPLTRENQINDYLLTSLRTRWGCDIRRVRSKYSFDLEKDRKDALEKLAAEGLIVLNRGVILLTAKGKLVADLVASQLFAE